MRLEPTPPRYQCMQCSMVLKNGREYHPYAACLMFQACRNGDPVRGNLQDVVDYGRDVPLEAE